jgi:hypothetical protein
MAEDVSFTIGGENAKFLQALRECQDAVNRTNSSIKAGFSGLNSSFQEVNKGFQGIGAVADEVSSKLRTAFEFTGLPVAYEAIKKVGEAVTELADRATQIRTMADVTGLSTAQFQTLSAASEESGVSIERTAHAVEHLDSLLNSAREGAGTAIDKLHQLGVTNEQIQDSTFGINELLVSLRQRLNAAGDSSDVMAALTREFGSRAAVAAEAIKAYDGSLGGVKKSMEDLNGLSDDQLKRLSEIGKQWHQFWTDVDNARSKLLIFISDFENARFAPQDVARPAAQQQGDPHAGEAAAARRQQAEDVKQLDQEMLREEMENVKAGVNAFKSGTNERLAALQEYARLARAYYGSNTVEEVVHANQAAAAEERAINEERLRSEKQFNEKIGQDKLRLISLEIAADGEYLNEAMRVMKEQEAAERKRYDDKLRAIHLEIEADGAYLKDVEEKAKQYEKAWKPVIDRVASEFTSNLSRMLSRQQSFAQSMRNIFANMAEGMIGSLIKVGVQAAINAAENRAETAGAAKSNVLSNAASAASAAMASAAQIPYVGWILAPIEGAAIYAAALAYGGQIPSAAGGYDIPAGLNPLTQLHEREMVLPAHIADVIRSGGYGAGGESHHYHGDVNIAGNDPVGALRTSRGQRELMKTISGAVRRGYRG